MQLLSLFREISANMPCIRDILEISEGAQDHADGAEMETGMTDKGEACASTSVGDKDLRA